MTHSYSGHDSFICMPWLIHMGATTHLFVSHDSCICVPWLSLHRDVEWRMPRQSQGHTYKWVMSHIWMSHVTFTWLCHHRVVDSVSHLWMSHITHMNESRHTYEWAMSHIWLTHISRESCLAWVMAHMSHGSHESCYTYEWAMSHIWLSHVSHESCLAWDMISHWFIFDYDSVFTGGIEGHHRVTESHMIYSEVWHGTFKCVIRTLQNTATHCNTLQHTATHCSTLIQMRNTTHSYVWHDSFICMTWLIHVLNMTHSYMWHDSCTRVYQQLAFWKHVDHPFGFIGH